MSVLGSKFADEFEQFLVNECNDEKAVNSFLKGDPLTLECEFEKDSVEKLKKLFNLPEDIQRIIIDIYNYMATNKNEKIVLQFENGIKMICEIDVPEWKNSPKIDLEEVLKGNEE